MRVLATADPLGGTFTYAVELARAAAPRGVQTVLATMGGRPSSAQVDAALSVPGLSLHASGYRVEWMDDAWDDLARAGDWLRRLVKATRADLVHHGSYTHAARDLGVPAVVFAHRELTTWWRAVKGQEAPARYDRYRAAVHAGLRTAEAVVAPTAAFLGELGARYGPLRGARTVHPGVALPRAKPDSKEPVVLAAGRLWDEAKNLAVLDRVAERLSWPVRIAGEVRHPDGRTVTAAHAALLGPLPRAALCRHLAKAAILCHPAAYEPFGLVPLEAAAHGCALVLGDLATLREVWGDAALYVPPGDADAVAAALDRLITQPMLRNSLAERAWQRARELTVGRMADATIAVWRMVATACA